MNAALLRAVSVQPNQGIEPSARPYEDPPVWPRCSGPAIARTAGTTCFLRIWLTWLPARAPWPRRQSSIMKHVYSSSGVQIHALKAVSDPGRTVLVPRVRGPSPTYRRSMNCPPPRCMVWATGRRQSTAGARWFRQLPFLLYGSLSRTGPTGSSSGGLARGADPYVASQADAAQYHLHYTLPGPVPVGSPRTSLSVPPDRAVALPAKSCRRP